MSIAPAAPADVAAEDVDFGAEDEEALEVVAAALAEEPTAVVLTAADAPPVVVAATDETPAEKPAHWVAMACSSVSRVVDGQYLAMQLLMALVFFTVFGGMVCG